MMDQLTSTMATTASQQSQQYRHEMNLDMQRGSSSNRSVGNTDGSYQATSTLSRWLGGGGGGGRTPIHSQQHEQQQSFSQSPNTDSSSSSSSNRRTHSSNGPTTSSNRNGSVVQQSRMNGYQSDSTTSGSSSSTTSLWSNTLHQVFGQPGDNKRKLTYVFLMIAIYVLWTGDNSATSSNSNDDIDVETFRRPAFVNERPYISSTYYSTTMSEATLYGGTEHNPQVHAKARLIASKGKQRKLTEPKTRLAILRPFCAFDAEALPTTFAAWQTLAPCKAAVSDIGDEDVNLDDLNSTSEDSYRPAAADAAADLFLFYSQTFADSPEAVTAVDEIIKVFNEPGGWSECFDNIYAAEANIPAELDLYIPSAQTELYNWVNGPNRQYEAAFRIIQSGEWGRYSGFYLMEGDSIPIKTHWLDRLYETIEHYRPFAILGAKYNGDKWDEFYQQIPYALLNHINGNGIYNTSHPLMERLVGQLEVEAPCPYNSIPYDFRMSQMIVEGQFGIVPELAPKIMLNEDGQNITLSDNTAMFAKWWSMWGDEQPMKETPIIHNYAATNLIPRHLGEEYVIHGAKLYAPWDPTETKISLVVSEWFADRSKHLLETLDDKEHPFSQVILMLPPDVMAKEEYNETLVPVKAHHRTVPDFMDFCEAPVETEWFMMTNSYHRVATHVDLMFTPGTNKPVCPFTPANYDFCFKFPYCKENVNLAQRIYPKHDKVVLDFDILIHTETRDAFCDQWKEEYGEEGEDLYTNDKRALRVSQFHGPRGPTATAFAAFLFLTGNDKRYKFTDRSLYGARPCFNKVFRLEEKLDGMAADEMAMLEASGELFNQTDCNCIQFETMDSCNMADFHCEWREAFDSCHPAGLLDYEEPSCPTTDSPTMAPTPDLGLDLLLAEEPPNSSIEPDMSYEESSGILDFFFKSREHTTTSGSPTTSPPVGVVTPAPTQAPTTTTANGTPAPTAAGTTTTNSTDVGTLEAGKV